MSDETAEEIEAALLAERKPKRGRSVTRSDIDLGCDRFWKRRGLPEPSSFNPFGELRNPNEAKDAGE